MSKSAQNKKFSAKNAARGSLKIIFEKLLEEVESGSGIARINAAAQLIKLADLDSIPQEVDDSPIEIRDADPLKQKVVPITAAS